MTVDIVRANYSDDEHGRHIVALLDTYARDPMGGGEPLTREAREAVVDGLAALPTAFSLIAFAGEQAVGLANCIFGFSTFAARPIVNIHDIVVDPAHRGKGTARSLFAEIEAIAQEHGACKITLEVLSGNERAKALYSSLGYGDYVLDPTLGNAIFWQKRLAS